MSLEKLCDRKIGDLTAIESDAGSPLLHKRARALKERFAALRAANDISLEGCTALLDALHQHQRLNFLYHAKASEQTMHGADAIEQKEHSWKELPLLAVDPALREKFAGRMMDGSFQHIKGGEYLDFNPNNPPHNKDQTMLSLTSYGRGVAEHIVSYMLRYDIPFETDFADFLFKKTLVESSDEASVQSLAAYHGGKFTDARKHIFLNSRPPAEVAKDTGLDPERKKQKIFEKATLDFEAKRRSGEVFYTTTRIPTLEDAALDRIPYDEYLKLFFELCDQPWHAIQKANAHLIDKLDNARNLHIIDPDTGTDLRMSIGGKQWVNSLILKNVPGSEVYASPTKESVNGKLVAKGRFQYKNSPVIEDITVIFKNGEVVDFSASTPEGTQALAKIIEADDAQGKGSRFLGEVGIGTNPWLRRHVINPLLVEKISGSIHLALGDAYKYTEYDGKPVLIDNSNRSASATHWDITTMMQGPNSRIVIDEGTENVETLMRAGKFIDPELNVLNEGWAAVENPPPYWQKRLRERMGTGWAAAV